jgi:hypothetical protein
MRDLGLRVVHLTNRIGFSFRQAIVRSAKPQCFKHFLTNLKRYTKAVAQEAELRETGEVLDLMNFVPLRRENSAVRCCFAFIEYNLGIELSDAVFNDPIFQSVYFAAVDMVCWINVGTSAAFLKAKIGN